jgi:drug/metabolite transporter (DMT)-like permease
MLPILLQRGLRGLAWWQVLALAATAGPGFSLAAFTALKFAPAAHAGVLMPGTLPLWTAILSVLVLGARLTSRQAASLALILAGIALIGWDTLGDLASGTAPPAQWIGDLLFMAASFSWAIYTVLARRWSVAPLTAAAIVCVVSGVGYMPIYLLALPVTLLAAPAWEIAVQALLQGIVSTIFTLIMFTRAAQALGAPTLTIFTALVPALVAVLAVPLLGETLSLFAALGAGLVVAGIAATVRGMGAAPAGR